MNKNTLLEDKFLICKFSFNIPLKSKVRVKEILDRHNKEIKWILEEIDDRDENGDKTITFRLINEKENLENLNDKIDLISGFIGDLYKTLGWSMTEEQINDFNSGFIGIHKGEVIKKLEIGKIKEKEIYFFRHLFGDLLNIFEEANKQNGKIPFQIIVDGYKGYQDGCRKAFRNWGNERKVKFTSIKGHRHEINNNAIENHHTLQKEFHKVRKGVKEVQKYQQDGFKVFHNYIRKGVKDKQTPAERCGIEVNGNRWNTMLMNSLENKPLVVNQIQNSRHLTQELNLEITP